MHNAGRQVLARVRDDCAPALLRVHKNVVAAVDPRQPPARIFQHPDKFIAVHGNAMVPPGLRCVKRRTDARSGGEGWFFHACPCSHHGHGQRPFAMGMAFPPASYAGNAAFSAIVYGSCVAVTFCEQGYLFAAVITRRQ